MLSHSHHYYITCEGKYDGNDQYFLSYEKKETTNIRKAKLFSKTEAEAIISVSDNYTAWPFLIIQSLICMHIPVSKLKKFKKKQEEIVKEPCFCLSLRDTTGKNATFWAFQHKGYTSEIRTAHIFSENERIKARTFEFFVPCNYVLKHMEPRIDVQDLHRLKSENKLPVEKYVRHHQLEYTLRNNNSTDENNDVEI